MSRILVVAETDADKVRESSFELVTLAREIASASGWEAVVAVLGADPGPAAAAAAERTGGRVLAVTDRALRDYTADAWTAALAAVVGKETPALVLATHGPFGWDWLPRLAARVDGACASEITSASSEGGALVFTRKSYNGRLEMRFQLAAAVQLCTVQRGTRAAATTMSGGSVETFNPALPEGTVRARFGGVTQAAVGKLDLTQASVIVSGGRALGGPEKFDIIRELAAALGGQVGASRPVTDSGWLPPEHQVGSSGTTVAPKLYIACGISGAIQHAVGMKGSDFIVAINKDARAPIFDIAHVGVVGDLFEIVPALTAAVKAARG